MSHQASDKWWGAAIAAIIVAAASVYIAGSWSVNLFDRDEAWYCQTSRQMVQSGNWTIPYFLDQPRYAKPILIYWLQAGSMRIFGPNEFAARLVSATAMTLTLSLLAIVLSRAIGRRRTALTLLIFATSVMVMVSAKMCLTDSVLLLFITGAQLCLFRVYWLAGNRRPITRAQNPREDQPPSTFRPVLLMWICIGLAALTKGPFILIILAATMVALGLFDVGRQWRSGTAWRRAIKWWKELRPLMGVGIVVLFLAPWVVAVIRKDPAFLSNMMQEPVRHVTSNQDGNWILPGYFLVAIWPTFFPWCLILPTALTMGWSHRRTPQVRFALATILGNWVFCEMMITKLPHYLLPSYSSLAFLTATALIRCARRQHDDLVRRAFFIFMGFWALIALGMAGVPWLAAKYFDDYSRPLAALFTGLAVVYVASVIVLFARQRLLAAAGAMGIGMLILIPILYAGYLPRANFLRLPSRVAANLRELGATREGEVIMTGFAEPSLAFYQGGTIRARDRFYLRSEPPNEWPTWIVTTQRMFESLPPERQAAVQIVARHRGLNYNTGQRIPEVLILRRLDRIEPQQTAATPTRGPQ